MLISMHDAHDTLNEVGQLCDETNIIQSVFCCISAKSNSEFGRNRTISLPFDFSGQQNSHQNQSDLSHIPSEIKIACGLGQSLDLASKA